ncbi:MAG TPA: hypothetical protein VIU61_19425 [Kofleriaceae bacterium]
MRIAVVLVLLGLAGTAHADERAWRLGAAGVSRFDPSGDGGFGLALQALRQRDDNAFGVLFEHTWLRPADDSPELGIRQLDVLAVARLGSPVSLELAAGLAVYHGRVDIPEEPGCFGCGKYDGSSVAPIGRLGVVWSHELGKGIAIEIGARVVGTRVVITVTDRHNFNPQPVTFQGSVGFSRAL